MARCRHPPDRASTPDPAPHHRDLGQSSGQGPPHAATRHPRRRTDRNPVIALPGTSRALLALAAVLLLTGCSGSDDAGAAAPAAGVTVVEPSTALEEIGVAGNTVIDVRTPAEHADGHLVGARNIDVSADTFTDQVSQLDRDATYVVYCRTGARSAEAAARMADLGFTDIRDAGALSDLVAAGGATETG
ncbi:rhodanese-like domain-containing protein [Modestobacter roseus]|uniref:rhodanese-like domain-containing protein n=1 Tax=Modestobacter roseus TaxID=1181884 RepID=UPI0034DF0023